MNPILHTIVVGTLSYLTLIIVLRVSGKRTLSKWNAFDFVTTIALGSILGAALTSTQVSLAQSITAFVVIVMLQFLITFISIRSRKVLRLIKSRPTLLLFSGQYCHEAMQRERVATTEILAAIREKGMADVEKVHAVVLETDGSFSVVGSAGDNDSTLEGVDGFPGR